ncbi:hypothetical protein [Aliarcobacter butzleri]|uniref:hypothetical protein n=1 Tax=Aliarcobacter butzleri TaxID=28197 RepID=UPI0019198F39|nr:hypothetical protein [Aliarcobacter butzleri]
MKFIEGFDYTFYIGEMGNLLNYEYSIRLSQPEDRKCANDYIIHWNGTHKFSDIHLFQNLDRNINTIAEMKKFLAYFTESPFIELSHECIKVLNDDREVNIMCYINRTNLNDTLKLCLASMIFRCDIDNINYQCPRLNGCIRHYIQILAIFAYKFNIEEWKLKEITPYIKDGNYPEIVSDSGYSYTEIGKKIGTKTFKDKYLELKRNFSEFFI